MIAVDVVFDRVFADLDVSPVPVRVELGYTAASPLVVQALFDTGDELVEWLIGRDLLRAGLTEPVGIGGVVVQPAPGGRVLIELASPDGDSMFSVPADALHEFLNATFAEVPAGSEVELIDLDTVIQGLLADEQEGSR